LERKNILLPAAVESFSALTVSDGKELKFRSVSDGKESKFRTFGDGKESKSALS
jgi:hypothetical protein